MTRRAASPMPTPRSTWCWPSAWWSTCRPATAARRWTSTIACSVPAVTSPSSTRRTARFHWRRTRWVCPWSSGCPRRWPGATRGLRVPAATEVSATRSSSPTAPAGEMPRGATASPRRVRRISRTSPRLPAMAGASSGTPRAPARAARCSPPSAPPAGCWARRGGARPWPSRTSTWSSASGDPHRDRGAELPPVPAAAPSAQDRIALARLAGAARPDQSGLQRDHLLGDERRRLRRHPRLCGGGAARVPGARPDQLGMGPGGLRSRARARRRQRLLHRAHRPARRQRGGGGAGGGSRPGLAHARPGGRARQRRDRGGDGAGAGSARAGRLRRYRLRDPEPPPLRAAARGVRRARPRGAAGRAPLSPRASPQRAAGGAPLPEVPLDLPRPRVLDRRAKLGDPRFPHSRRAGVAVRGRRIRGRPRVGLLDPLLAADPARRRAPLPAGGALGPSPRPAALRPRARGRGAAEPLVSDPAVSVLMAVRDGAPWVAEAVASVLGQTAGDLELIVIDDGSTDATPELLARVRDARLRVDRRAAAGLTPSLNRGLALARAPLVARLDADDLALPERLARQGAFLAAHPEVG